MRLSEIRKHADSPGAWIRCLKQVASDGPQELRPLAIEALGWLGPESAPSVQRLLRTDQPPESAARAILVMWPKPKGPLVVDLLEAHQRTKRWVFCKAAIAFGKEAVEPAVTLLARADDELAGAVWDVLDDLDRDAAARLGPFLDHENARIRVVAARLLLRHGRYVAESAKRMLSALDSKDQWVRSSARALSSEVATLRDSPDQGGAFPEGRELSQVLTNALGRDLLRVRTESAATLGALWRRMPRVVTPDAVPQLHALLQEQDSDARIAALEGLAAAGPQAVPTIPTILEILAASDDFDLQLEAVHALGRMGPQARSALPRLRRLITDPSFALSFAAAAAVFRIAGPEPAAVSVVREALVNSDKFLLGGAPDAVEFLETIGDSAKPFVGDVAQAIPNYPLASRLLMKLRPEGVEEAARALSWLDAEMASEVVADLVSADLSSTKAPAILRDLLLSKRLDTRLAAAATLLESGIESEQATEVFWEALDAGGPAIASALRYRRAVGRYAAQALLAAVPRWPDACRVRALATLADAVHNVRSVPPQLATWIADPSEPAAVRTHSLRLLGKIGEPARPLAQLCARLAEEKDGGAVAETALVALARMGGEVAQNSLPLVHRRLRSDSMPMRVAAGLALWYIARSPAGIVAALRDPSPFVRRYACRMVEPDRKLVLQLRIQLADLVVDPVPNVRIAAIATIATIRDSADAKAALRLRAADEDELERIRVAAREALSGTG